LLGRLFRCSTCLEDEQDPARESQVLFLSDREQETLAQESTDSMRKVKGDE